MRQQHPKRERAIRLVYSPYANFALHPIPQTNPKGVSSGDPNSSFSVKIQN
jgi:hypothetical protein